MSPPARSAAPTHTTAFAAIPIHARQGVPSFNGKTNSIIGQQIALTQTGINSRWVDKNVHASIERISAFEKHKRQVDLIMNQSRSGHSNKPGGQSLTISRDEAKYRELMELAQGREQSTMNEKIKRSVELDK